jgi:hypothetical protein
MPDAALTSEPLAEIPAQIVVAPGKSSVRDETATAEFDSLLS